MIHLWSNGNEKFREEDKWPNIFILAWCWMKMFHLTMFAHLTTQPGVFGKTISDAIVWKSRRGWRINIAWLLHSLSRASTDLKLRPDGVSGRKIHKMSVGESWTIQWSKLIFRLTTFLDYTRTLVYLASFGYTHQENEPSLSTAVTGERNIKSVFFSIHSLTSIRVLEPSWHSLVESFCRVFCRALYVPIQVPLLLLFKEVKPVAHWREASCLVSKAVSSDSLKSIEQFWNDCRKKWRHCDCYA